MLEYQEPAEPTCAGETDGEWVDFPASPEPDPWTNLLRKANRRPPAFPELIQAKAHRLRGAHR